MKLSYEQLLPLIHGAVRTEEKDGRICFYRFTEEQSEAYLARSKDFYNKNFATAGVRIEMITDSPTLSLTVEVLPGGSSRKYFSHSIYENGRRIGSIDAPDREIPIHSGSFSLSEGEKKICIYFPWSAISRLVSLELADGARVEAVRKNKKLLLFGDSITQGYDSADPARSYASRLTDALCAEGINKGIGGERFFPALATLRDDFLPDYITVAYGTNDWSSSAPEVFQTDCRAFYENLRALYPDVKIFAMRPLWRPDGDRTTACGSFAEASAFIPQAVADIPGITVIDCYAFSPVNDNRYVSDRLHPNDQGFDAFAEHLIPLIS